MRLYNSNVLSVRNDSIKTAGINRMLHPEEWRNYDL
jgi:hypothetical protein